ncbi:MAG: hypothetical protein COA44_01890 [Arcobacter sp.]|nr:MAG: hypothetical protein COA44_01890 [Arcobacter sp.]
MNSYLKLFLLPIILIITACTPKPMHDKDVIYSQADLEKRKLLNHTYKLLDEMQSIDAALYLNKVDFTDIINHTFSNFTEHFTLLDAPAFSKPLFGRMKINLKDQKVQSRVDFSFEVDSLNREIFGHLSARHTLQAGKNIFVIHTNFDEIVLDRIDETRPLEDNTKNKELIASAVKSFLHTLNVEIINMPLVLKVDMNILDGIHGKDIVSAKDYTLHSASSVSMHTKMDSYLPYVSKKGIILLGTLKHTRNKAYKNKINLKTLEKLLTQRLNEDLLTYMGINLDSLQKYSSYYISKAYLSKQMNKALIKMDLRSINKFFLNISPEESSFEKNIYFFDKARLPSCQGVKEDCSKRLNICNRQCSVKYGPHSCVQCDDMRNPFAQVRCLSKLEACKSKEELHLYECNKHEDSCELDNVEIKTLCEVQNLELVSICKEDKEELLFINDEIVLAKMKLDFKIANSYAVQRIRSIKFDSRLKRLEVSRDMHISVDSRLGVSIENSHINDINCSLKVKEDLLTHSEVDFVKQLRDLDVLTQRLKDGKLLIKAISKPIFMSIQIKNKPYEKLMQDKNFKLQCYYKNMPLQAISNSKLLAVKDIPYALNPILGEVELAFEDEELSFVISPVILNDNIMFYPTMEEKAISFSRQAHFY